MTQFIAVNDWTYPHDANQPTVSAAFQSPAGGAATLSKAPAALGGEESSAGMNPAALELKR